MARIGRNDPCPCGSGKKYKRCCGDQPAPSLPPVNQAPAELRPRDRRLTERALAQVHQLMAGRDFESVDEMNAFLQEALAAGPLPELEPDTPLAQAEALIYEALEAEGRERVKLARRALQLSPDCADAYVLLAEETAGTAREAYDLYKRGVEAGERALGPRPFEEDAGHFWGILETRPYMRARAGLADALIGLGRVGEAIGHLGDLLRLNPGDNQGLRYLLLQLLLERDDRPGVHAMFEAYPDDSAAQWDYSAALLAFREQGDSRAARTQLGRALKANPYVPAYLLGAVPFPDRPPAYVGVGDESEGIHTTLTLARAWLETPGAVDWLGNYVEREAKRRDAAAEKVPREMQGRFDELAALIEPVCREHLTEEYAQVGRRMAAALCRKRPSPVLQGRPASWACGIVYALGQINFLFDKASAPYLSAGELCGAFGVSTGTGGAKALEVRRALKLGLYDPAWILPSMIDSHPFARWAAREDSFPGELWS